MSDEVYLTEMLHLKSLIIINKLKNNVIVRV